MSQVFVIDQQKQPQMPVHPAQARRLLSGGKAAVWRRFPFTIILKEEEEQTLEPTPLRLKLDPGSKTTGIALVDDEQGRVVWAAELTHRGQTIRDTLLKRRASVAAGGGAKRATVLRAFSIARGLLAG